jgi:spermidine/putrescine transport system ATP-binding protein
MRTELRAIQKRVNITFIYITHDQGEALTMSDRVAVMSEGVIEQMSDSASIYDRPETAFVASFVGENNPFFGKVAEISGDQARVETDLGSFSARLSGTNGGAKLQPGEQAIMFVRPESLTFVNGGDAPENTLRTRILQEEFEGSFRHITLEGVNGKEIKMSLVNSGQSLGQTVGSEVTVGFRTDLAVALPEGPLASE